MIYTEPLFLGVTPTGARNYVADKAASLKKPFFNTCAGRFSVVEAAIKAGVLPQNIYASDIGLFWSIIGYLADPSKKLDNLGIRILDPALKPEAVADELDFAAHVMLILKLNKVPSKNDLPAPLKGPISCPATSKSTTYSRTFLPPFTF
jgi:hypothetical protein